MSVEQQKIEAKKELKKLVDNFKEHIESYKDPNYNESTLRIDYLNKFFKLLGWDVTNEQNLPPSYREVVTEDRVHIEGRSKAPDYAFRLTNGKRLFFAEAKKPSVNITKHADSAFQLRRYGWSADLSVSILTNFESFAVYDCAIKPLNTDQVKKAQLKFIHYEDYLEEFDYIWERFSKESVLKDSLATHFGAKKKKKGSASVDDDFLDSLDGWRIALARDINENNILDEDRLNYVVQQTIDRIIFLRIAEDRDVEDYGSIQRCLDEKGVYKNLFDLFVKADQKYNSGLFKEDGVSANVKINDSVISKIVKGLYYPKSPYEFSVLPIEILGKAYEQFLGKKITLTNAGNIKIEDKPEVKKAGGVYYTPREIVEYIVKQTVGSICDGKTPEQVEKVKILDPASGSGSFLIGAYEYLLDWYKDFFSKNPNEYSKKKMAEIVTPSGDLTTKFKGKVLLDNIYGVDIDHNAVEVTKLSLLLKCMEGETKETISAQKSFFQERLLPTLDNNIKSGNSLIDFDIYIKFPDLSDDVKIKRRINAFNWKNGFREVFNNKGFDVVIGNPPYIHSRDELLFEREKDFFYKKYSTAEYQINTYCLFIEKSFELLKANGLLGFIVPNYWLSTDYDKNLRRILYQNKQTLEIVNVYNVFKNATVDTVMLVSSNSDRKDSLRLLSIDKNIKSIEERLLKVAKSEWTFQKRIEPEGLTELSMLSFANTFELSADKTIKDYFYLKFGAKLYEVGKGTPPQTSDFSREAVYESNRKLNKSYKKLLRARHIKHYSISWENDWVKYGDNLAAPRNPDIFYGNRILVQRIVSKPLLECTYLNEEYICNTDVITLKPHSNNVECKFFLAILNSKLCSAYVKARNVNLDRAAFPKINTNTLESFPVPNFESTDKNISAKIIDLVNKVLELSENNAHSRIESIQQEILFYEDSLNKIIYGLYELADSDIQQIEELFK